jgi:hypothetical protein
MAPILYALTEFLISVVCQVDAFFSDMKRMVEVEPIQIPKSVLYRTYSVPFFLKVQMLCNE